jgi:hypothetical protein
MAAVQTGALAPGPDHQQQQQQHKCNTSCLNYFSWQLHFMSTTLITVECQDISVLEYKTLANWRRK